jgi:signal transduction histidine kinase
MLVADWRPAIKGLGIPETRRSRYADMKQKLIRLSQRYAAALRKHLNRAPRDLEPALKLGREAAALGLETLELARIHEQALTALELSESKDGVIERAEIFFTEAIAPIEETHRAARQSKNDLNRVNGTLDRRTAELAATNRQLQRGITQRKSVEAALKKSGDHYARLLKESVQLQERLQQLTYQVLTAQEDERKKISRELQNEIAQTLLGVNVRLLSLRQEARNNTSGLANEIAGTQRLVAKSATFVRRFARELGSPDEAHSDRLIQVL